MWYMCGYGTVQSSRDAVALLKDKLMLSGEETSWRVLKEALPTLEELKAKSSILFPSCAATVGEQWPVFAPHLPTATAV